MFIDFLFKKYTDSLSPHPLSHAEPAMPTILGHFGNEITSKEDDSATAAPLINASSLQQDAVSVMTTLRSYTDWKSDAKGLAFTTACQVLIRDFREIYPEWAKLAKIACVIPVSSVPAENRIKTAQRNRLGGGQVTWLMQITSCEKKLDDFDFNSTAASFDTVKKRRK